jgi:transposase
MSNDHRPKQIAIRTYLGAILVSMQLSRSVWLITSRSSDAGEKTAKYSVKSRNV